MKSTTKNLVMVVMLALLLILGSVMIVMTIQKTANEEVVYADAPAWTGKGSGAKGDPFLITTAEELGLFRDRVNSTGSVGENHAVLANDITLPDEEWTPIGIQVSASICPFKWIFDGNGHTIRGLKHTTASDTYVGLFGYVSSTAEIRNVTVEGDGLVGRDCVGGIAGFITGSVDTTGDTDIEYKAKIINCHNYVPINGNNNVGGIVGKSQYSVEIVCCSNHAEVKSDNQTNPSSDSGCVGGIVGYAYGRRFEAHQITNTFTSIQNCYNDGKVTAKDVVISETTYHPSKIGGLIGAVYYYAGITNSFNYESVTADAGATNLGAIVGYKVTNTHTASASNTYYRTIEGSATEVSTIATAHNADWFTAKGNFSNWDFSNTWQMLENASYPTYLPPLDIYIDGHRVAAGIQRQEIGDYGWSYSRTSKTLTLGQGNYAFRTGSPTWIPTIYIEEDDITIYIYNAVRINITNDGENLTSCAIYSKGDLNITGFNDSYRMEIDSTEGVTKDFYGRVIGRGDILNSLIKYDK